MQRSMRWNGCKVERAQGGTVSEVKRSARWNGQRGGTVSEVERSARWNGQRDGTMARWNGGDVGAVREPPLRGFTNRPYRPMQYRCDSVRRKIRPPAMASDDSV